MKRARMMIAYTGLASAVLGVSSGLASGASTFGAHLSFDATDAAMGGIVTATLTATWDGHGANTYFQAVAIDLIASSQDVYAVIDVAPVLWNNPLIGLDGQGVASGADVLRIEASQLSLLPPVDNSNPIVIMTFSLRRIGTGSVTYTARVASGAPGAFFLDGTFGHNPVPPYGPEFMTSDTLLGTPSPGVLGVVGVGGLLAGRRRRVG